MKKAGDILSVLFNEKFDPRFLEKARTTAGLFNSWTLVTEEAGIASAASHSRISELERNILLIDAEHPGWVQILQTSQTRLLKAIQRRYPELEIHGIAFRLGRDSHFPLPDPPAVETGEPALPIHSDHSKPIVDEDYLLSKQRLEESIKKRNELK
jgi:hypothetical protein